MVQKSAKSDAPIAVRFGFSVVAAACSEATTYPLDMTKTRLQVGYISGLDRENAVSKGLFRF